jgi:cystathionine beta-synthase
MWHEDILGTIGATPLVRVNRLAAGLPGTVLAKLELFNPGSSVKDRIGVSMVNAAEKDGSLKPGGTIIEGTSGNTGTGLALVAIARGYRCIFTTTDKQSPEKLSVLRALGAEVVVCPTNVHPKDPRSYYMVARRLAKEIPNSFYINQYDNPANAPAHYVGTGPEIWKDTDGRVTHFIAGAGTGGTISGTARYLKEQNPKIKVVGVDPFGSVYFKYWRTREFDEKEIYPYITEGVGEDILAGNMDFDLVDDYVRVTDRDSMLMTRRLCREEGMFVGGSCGMAMAGALQWMGEHRGELTPKDVVVVLLPDSGFRYLNKIYNDRWMQDRGFIERTPEMTAEHVLMARPRSKELISVPHDATVSDAIAMLARNDVSQAPVMREGEPVGSLTESALLTLLITQPESKSRLVSDVMGEPFPLIDVGTPMSDLGAQLENKRGAVLVRAGAGRLEILTKTDLISALAAK